MKTKSLFSKLFPSYFFISLIGLIILLIITRFAFKNFYYQETKNDLTQIARIIEKDIVFKLNNNQIDKIQDKVNEISKITKNRISVILPSGKVIADTDHDPKTMENHKDRVEISKALKGKVGESIRFSPTLKNNHLYIAIPLKNKGNTIGVLRNSVSLIKLDESIINLTQNILFWSCILLILLTYFIYLQARKISAPLEEMSKQIGTFSTSKFQVDQFQIKHIPTKEISSLYSTIQEMGIKLQKQFEKIDKQKNEQLAIFASMAEGVITIYPDMNIYHINRAALNLFNYTSEDNLKGTPLTEVVQSKQIKRIAKNLLKTQKPIDEEIHLSNDKILLIHGTILKSEETGMNGAVLVFNDITKMRELELHRKQFVANVSHELKTPLTSIQGYIETLVDEDVNDEKTIKKFLGIISKHSTRLKTIIEDLLTLSNLEKESEVGDLELKAQSILPVIENTISLCQSKAAHKNINIINLAKEIEVEINAPLIEQAIINLLDNAIKYGPEQSDVRIETFVESEFLEIHISDKGAGIDPIHHERLFERFYSVDKARSRELGGSGLGLSIVKHICLSHRGEVSLKSTLNEGSTFIIKLPLTNNL